MLLISIIILIIEFIAFSLGESVRYDSYQVYFVNPETREQYKAFLKLERLDEFEIIRDHPAEKSARVLVPPRKRSAFQSFLNKTGVPHKVENHNIQAALDAERIRLSSKNISKMDWTEFHPLNVLYAWLDELESKYTNVKVIIGGKSHEGRDIKGIEINNGQNLPGIVIEAGIHSREWITIAGSSWIINEILRSSSDSIWRKFNYLYFPCYNPDGYVYSWTTDRFWRKTRKLYRHGTENCYGVDANRNWDSHWGIGSSKHPCSETFGGPKPFSEIETKTISEYLKKIAKIRNNKIYISYHSYYQQLMFPWGHDKVHAPEHDLWLNISKLAAEALHKVHGTAIQTGSIYDTIYQASGLATDYYYEKLNATIPFIYEMRNERPYNWLIPPEEIIPVGEEQFASLKIILEEYLKLEI